MTATRVDFTSPQQAFEHCAQLDLSMIKMKLRDGEEGPGWSEATADVAQVEYLRFLALTLAYPEESIVPSKMVDHVWHAHILDTQAYARDCEKVFGFFLHHFPYFGLRGEEDAANLHSAYDRTIDLYQAHFGVPTVEFWGTKAAGAADCSTPSECNGGSSPGGCTSRCTGGS